jgi:phosphopantothenoylcysteine decarboxylase/phosphopantothenate--cysteine ligase
VAFVGNFFKKQSAQNQDLVGRTVLVTAGPTYEALDPVRFIGNRSSGKMGFAIVNELAQRGAAVHLVVGPTKLPIDFAKSVSVVKVESAQQMFEAATAVFGQCDAAILAAAVADYRPKVVSDVKIKKKEGEMTLELEKTPDIAATLGQLKQAHQRIVGFALETNNEFKNAVSKLNRKNFDAVVLNSLQDAGAGFSGDTNKISIILKSIVGGDTSNGGGVAGGGHAITHFKLKPKKEVAKDIIDALLTLF